MIEKKRKRKKKFEAFLIDLGNLIFDFFLLCCAPQNKIK